jgi:hypothetical protein
MSKVEFFRLVEADLRLRHVPLHEPEPQRWAEAFLVAKVGGRRRA